MDSEFSAKEPSLGYFYQVRYGLNLLLTSKNNENLKLLIESLDDIEIRRSDGVHIFQTKYHLKKETNLSDRSSDFWKTIRVWSKQIKDNKIKVDETIFSLVTTQKLSNKSVLIDIKNKTNVDSVISKLLDIAEEKTNNNNEKGYLAFKSLNSIDRKKLIENIYIVDASLDFNEIDKSIKNELRLSALPNKIDSLLERLDGWFFSSCILHLQNKKEYISFDDVQKKILHILDDFKYDNLPVDFPEKIIPTDEELNDISSMNFYKQLDLIDLSPRLSGREREHILNSFAPPHSLFCHSF